jgi:hypothetical protein
LFIPPYSYKTWQKILFNFPILLRSKPFSSMLYDCLGWILCLAI